MKNFGEKAAWAYLGTAKIFSVPPIISGTGKTTNFKYCTHILSIDQNKSPVYFGKSSRGRSQDSGMEIFLGTHILDASRGRLCDSSTFLFVACRCLVSRANDWLRSNRDVTVRTCQTVTWSSHDLRTLATPDGGVGELMILSRGFADNAATFYIRGLR